MPADPMYGGLSSALMNGAASKKSSPSTVGSFANMLSRMTFEQALGISAVAGTSVFVVKVVRYAKKTSKSPDDSDNDSQTMTKSASLSILGFIRRLLRKLLLDDPPDVASQKSIEKHVPSSPGDGKIITHNGSCHCESIQFQVMAPRCINAKEGPGKIQYRHTQVNAQNFCVHNGQECLKTYYIYRNNARKGAHAFCERCGVHILYAPSRRTPMLNINVNCLHGNGISKVRVVSKKDDISEGFPADGQWNSSDQLSTISEVTQPFHFQLGHMNSATSGDWNSYGRNNSSDLYSVGEADDDVDSTSVPIKKVSVPPPNPVTPSTVNSSTIELDSEYGSQIAQLKMMAPRSLSGHGASANSLADDLTTDDMSL
ncbi:MAG: hypothetical protein SGILL_010494, partial [Bacillariaceae sp.]